MLHERSEPDGGTLPAGSTRVVVTLEEEDGGSRVTVRHQDLPTDELRDAQRVAWQTYLSRLPVRIAGGDPGPDPHA
ncbi:MAG TPA: SRPBCC domain-containing protein [Streptosporangiaceae bacterium]|nr:SRPBCC domain-containing protein [Streptosporangiaceae bacterium]